MASTKLAIEVEIKNIKKVADLKTELKSLRKEQTELEKQSKTGQFTSKKQEQQYIKNSKAISQKSKQLRDLNKNLKATNSETKKVTKSSNGLAKQFVKGAAAIGIIVTAFRTVSRVVSSVVSTFSDFQFVMAKVNAISGATEQEFQGLTKTAEKLGRTTFFTATQVGELMLNFSKLGFSTQEIQNAVEPTLALATATGSDLARSAIVAGAAVRGFGLDASETQRVVDVMAVSFSSSAMDMEKWQTSMTKVAPIAKSAGFSIEDTAAIMSKLTDSGIEASIAGTSLRNILLKMQDPASDLSKAFGGTVHSLDGLVPAMKKFNEEGGDLAAIMEVVDLRQAAAFEQMITSADATLELRDKLKLARGEADRMAKVIGDTLQGSFLKFSSALQGLSIAVMKDFAEGLQSAIEKTAAFFNMLARNSEVINTSIKVIIRLAKYVGVYKLLIAAMPALQRAWAATLTATSSAASITATATTLLSSAVVRLKLAFQSLLGATGIGLLVVALTEGVSWLLRTATATEEVVEATEEYIDAETTLQGILDHTNKVMNKRLGVTQAMARQNIDDIKTQIDLSELQLYKNLKGIHKLSHDEREAHEKAVKRFKFRLKLEKKNLEKIIETDKHEKLMKTDLLVLANEELKLIRETPAATDKEVAARNKNIAKIEKEIKRLKELGIEKENVVKKDIVSMDITDPFTSSEEDRQKLIDADKKADDDYFAQQEEKGKQRLEMFKTFSDSIFSIIGNNAQRRADREAKELEERKESGVITQEQYEAQLLQVQKKAFERKKRMDIAQAIVNGALAMTKVTAQTGILAFGFSPFIAAMTAAQIAVIASQKFAKGGLIEKFADGGMVNGKSHAQGGEKFAVGGRVAELEGGEAVINKRSTAMFKTQLSAMNAAGGGVKFADGGLLNMPSFASSQFSAIGQQNMMNAMSQNNKVVVVESDITNSQNTVGLIEAEATF
jgi:TP901 family phage tail tape measure protein